MFSEQIGGGNFTSLSLSLCRSLCLLLCLPGMAFFVSSCSEEPLPGAMPRAVTRTADTDSGATAGGLEVSIDSTWAAVHVVKF